MVLYHFKVNTDTLKIQNINPKTITKVAQQSFITDKTIKEIKVGYKIYK